MTRHKTQARNIISVDVWENEGGAPGSGVPEYMQNTIDTDQLAEGIDRLVVNRWRTELRRKLIDNSSFPEPSAWMGPMS